MQAASGPAKLCLYMFKVDARVSALFTAEAAFRMVSMDGPGGALSVPEEAAHAYLVGLDRTTVADMGMVLKAARSTGAAVLGVRLHGTEAGVRDELLAGLDEVLDLPAMRAGSLGGGLGVTILDRARAGRKQIPAEARVGATLPDEDCVTRWELDLESRRFAHPEAMMRLLGLVPGNDGLSLARFFEAAVSGEEPAVRACMEAAIIDKHAVSVSFQIVKPDGASTTIAMSGCPSRTPTGRWRLAGVAFDIANICHAELEMLRRADRSKNEFIATMAHELRNPLAAVLCASELVGSAAPADSTIAAAAAALRRQTRHLARLVDELRFIGYSGVARRPKHMEICRFDDVLRDAVEQVLPRMAARAHCFAVESPPSGELVHGNFTQLVQIVANLLNNASKYTPDAGTIRVWIESSGESVRCTITDSGIGMAAEFIGRAFDAFVQAESDHATMHEGIGLGLKLVRELAEIHGGTVRAHSAGKGCGTTLVLELPLACRSAPR